MRPIQTRTLSDLLGGELQAQENAMVYGFATDHRQVRAGDAFLAISGARFDGHEFIDQALENGAVVCIVEREVEGPYIFVRNLVDALATMGRRIRGTYRGPVIGVTGSAGKTTTKELIVAALRPLGKILATEGNRNSEFTSPLLWAGLDPLPEFDAHGFASSQDFTTGTAAVVVEMAMRGFGQIAHLAALNKPTIGVITNIGYSHMEMVKSRDGVARAKGELIESLDPDGIAILWAEDDYLDTLSRMADGRVVRTFGTSPGANCRITDYRPLDWHRSEVHGTLDGAPWTAIVPMVGRHIALNAAAAILAAHACGVDPTEAAESLQFAQFPPMRMEVRKHHGASILVDTYNSSPPATLAAVETLLEMPVEGRRVAVLGDMKELGNESDALHAEVGRALGALDSVLFFGDSMNRFAKPEAEQVGLRDGRTAGSIEDVMAFLDELGLGDAALVKGSRALELERALGNPPI